MFSVKKFKIVSLLSIFIIVLSFSTSIAQLSSLKSVAIVFPFLSNTDYPGNIISKRIEGLFKKKNIHIDDLAQVAIVVIPTEIKESEKIVITFLFTKTLPEEIMNYNIENETAYLNNPNKDNLPKEGKVIREYLTKEQLSYYRKIWFASYFKTIISDKLSLDADLENIVEEASNFKFRK